jgi:serine/threonine protein kinase
MLLESLDIGGRGDCIGNAMRRKAGLAGPCRDVRAGAYNPRVMQDLEDDTLATLLRKGPLDVETAIRYASDIGVALDAAHSRGIVHRALKPANVMITAAGARLLDVGPAVPGPYMAPEQLQGQPSDARSDVFSLGAMLYEMLTGRRPFIATAEAGVMTQTLGLMPPPPSSLNRAVTPAVDAVVARCLATTPADRWPTVRAVLNSLTVALHESRDMRTVPRWSYAAAAAAALLIAVAAGCPYVN